MHVPTDAFGGMSPEYKAASALKNLFTMVAVRVGATAEATVGATAEAMAEAMEAAAVPVVPVAKA